LLASTDVAHRDDSDRGELARNEPLHVVIGKAVNIFALRVVAELRVAGGDGNLFELEEPRALLADQLDDRWRLGCGDRFHGGSQDGAVVRSAQATIRRDDEQQLRLGLAGSWPSDERMGEVARGGGKLADEVEHAVRIGLGGGRLLLSTGKLARRDHLHRFGDAADVRDSLHSQLDFTDLSHGANSVARVADSFESRRD
jgi:hypothetical protein